MKTINSTFKIGHYSNIKDGTGCTVIIPPKDNIASAAAKSASPGTREIALLAPDKKILTINALVLSGGSAFGLNAAQGIMEALAAKGEGYYTKYGPVPIVPSAVIFDKNVGSPAVFPSKENAVAALEDASFNNMICGNVGAGTGATVGKWRGIEYAMKGGLGTAFKEFDGLQISAVTVVNSVGDIKDFGGEIIAGALDDHKHFYADTTPFHQSQKPKVGEIENTVLCAVLTNANISKLQACYLAERAHFGIARRIEPSHTSYDGDVAFVIAQPKVNFDIDLLSSLMINTVEESIITAIKFAKSAYGLHSYEDLKIK